MKLLFLVVLRTHHFKNCIIYKYSIENRENGQRLVKFSSRALAFCYLGMLYLVITRNRAKDAFTEEEQKNGFI